MSKSNNDFKDIKNNKSELFENDFLKNSCGDIVQLDNGEFVLIIGYSNMTEAEKSKAKKSVLRFNEMESKGLVGGKDG